MSFFKIPELKGHKAVFGSTSSEIIDGFVKLYKYLLGENYYYYQLTHIISNQGSYELHVLYIECDYFLDIQDMVDYITELTEKVKDATICSYTRDLMNVRQDENN